MAYKLAARYPRLAETPLVELQRVQARAFRDQALQADARAKGMHIEREVSFDWPVRSPVSV